MNPKRLKVTDSTTKPLLPFTGPKSNLGMNRVRV